MTYRSRSHFSLAIVAAIFLVDSQPVAAEETEVCRYCRDAAQAFSTGDDDAPPHSKERTRHYAPDRDVDVTHIKLDVTPDFDHHTIAGSATLRFTPIAKPLASLRLDGVNLKVKGVRSSHKVRNWSADSKNVTIVFADPVPAGAESYVEIDYSAEPLEGLYFCSPDMGFPASDTLCWTQGETQEARHWFPCFDSPNERASTELVAHVPADMTVVSNGRLVAETASDATAKDGSKLKTVHWLQEKPHVSYLICFLAGHLQKIEDHHGKVPLGYYTQPSKAKYAASGLQGTADIMDFYEKEIGVDYPWDKYDQCTIPDFMWGGMENTSITTLTQRALFENPNDTIHEGSTRSLEAHEMAHQWFGDLVTCKDWSQLWLNEGFATFYALLYEGHKLGRDAYLHGLYIDGHEEIFLPENVHDTRPIVFREYDEPQEQFDFRNYPKASWVLHMLRSQVGDDLFRQAIRNYLKRHAPGDVTTDDLRKEFEEVSGKPLDKFFDQWVYHGGVPELKIEYDWRPEERLAHVSVEQTQKVSDNVLLFEFPTTLRFVVGGKIVDKPIEIKERKQDFYVPLPAEPEIVRFDPDYTVLAKIEFEKSDALLEADLKNDSDVMGRIFACEGLAKRPTSTSVAALKHALESDPYFGVRQSAATALRKIGSEEATAALVASADQTDVRVRRTVVDELGKCYSDAARKKLHEIAANEKLPVVAAAAITGLGRTDREHAADAIHQALVSQSLNNERLLAAFLAIRETNDPLWQADLMKTLKARINEIEPRSLLQGFQTLAQISQRDERQAAAYEFIVGYLDSPREPARNAAINALGYLHDARARAVLLPLTNEGQIDRTQRAAKKALATLDKQPELVPDEVEQLRRELRDLRDGQEKLKKTIDELKAKSAAK